MQIVETWADINFDTHIFLSLVEEVNNIASPLDKYFGLDTFNYMKTYNNSQVRLTNTPDFFHSYLEKKLYQKNIFELPAHNYVQNRIIWSNIDTHKLILEEANRFNIRYGVTIIEPAADGCEFFSWVLLGMISLLLTVI